MMEFISNNSTYIITGGVTIVVVALGVYFFPKPVVQPTIEYVSQSAIEDVSQPAIEYVSHTIHHYIPSIPVTDAECARFTEIFKDNSLGRSFFDHFLHQRALLLSEIRASNHNLTEELALELLAEKLPFVSSWNLFTSYLRTTIPPKALIDAISNHTLSLFETYDSIIKVPIPIKNPEIPTPPSSWLTSFSEFFTSEFGIKCLIVGSVVTLPIIISHLLIKYYFKTTYKAIFIAIKQILFKSAITIKQILFKSAITIKQILFKSAIAIKHFLFR